MAKKKTKEKEVRHTCTRCKTKRIESSMVMVTGRHGMFPRLAGRGYVWRCIECPKKLRPPQKK